MIPKIFGRRTHEKLNLLAKVNIDLRGEIREYMRRADALEEDHGEVLKQVLARLNGDLSSCGDDALFEELTKRGSLKVRPGTGKEIIVLRYTDDNVWTYRCGPEDVIVFRPESGHDLAGWLCENWPRLDRGGE